MPCVWKILQRTIDKGFSHIRADRFYSIALFFCQSFCALIIKAFGFTPRLHFDCQTAPLLVSERQGLGKSTFCRMLLPECLRMYYSDKFDLSSDSHAEKLLGQFALINMDEFDRYSERQMGVLKNLMQLTDVKMRRPRSRGLSEVRRVAAFIGTSNYSELLADPTGSRRFFCQVVDRPIGNAPIDYEQLYAQAVAEIGAGEPTFFSKEEEAEI